MRVCQAIQAVVFDMDGLLLDTERVFLEAFGRAQRRLGLGICKEAYFGMVGLNTRDLKIALNECLPSDTNAERFHQQWNLEIRALFEEPIAVKDGARELCTFLKDAEVPCAVATSSDAENASARLERVGLDDFFSVLVGGDQIRSGKPAPDTYLEAAKRLGTEPKNTVAFEDSDVGVHAALAAGMITVQVPDLLQPDGEDEETRPLDCARYLGWRKISGALRDVEIARSAQFGLPIGSNSDRASRSQLGGYCGRDIWREALLPATNSSGRRAIIPENAPENMSLFESVAGPRGTVVRGTRIITLTR